MLKKLITKAELARLSGVTAGATTRACKTILLDAVYGARIDANHPKVIDYINRVDDVTKNAPAMGIDSRYEEAVTLCLETGRFTVSNISRKMKIGQARAKRIFAMIQAAGLDKPSGLSKIANALPPPPPPPEKPAAVKTVVTGTTQRNHTKKSAAIENLNNGIEQGSMIHEIPEDIKNFVDITLRELIQRFGTDIAFLDWLKATKEIENINEKRLKNAQTRGELVNRILVKNGVIEPFDTAFNKLLTDGAKTIARRVSAMTGAGRSVEDCEKFVADQISSFIKPMKAKISRTLKNA